MITSNLKEVIARVEAYERGLPRCVDRALAKTFWLPWLRTRASAALAHQFTLLPDLADRERYLKRLPAMLDLVEGMVTPGLAQFTFGILPETVGAVNLPAAAQYAKLNWTPSGRARKNALPDALAADNLAAARQAVRDWVELEKTWKTGPGERDEGLTTDQIVHNIEVVLGLSPSMSYQNAAMQEAAAGVRRAIEAWLNGEENTRPDGSGHAITTPATDPTRNLPARKSVISGPLVQQWLAAVLQTWLANFPTVLRDRLRKELDTLHREVAAKQQKLL